MNRQLVARELIRIAALMGKGLSDKAMFKLGWYKVYNENIKGLMEFEDELKQYRGEGGTVYRGIGWRNNDIQAIGDISEYPFKIGSKVTYQKGESPTAWTKTKWKAKEFAHLRGEEYWVVLEANVKQSQILVDFTLIEDIGGEEEIILKPVPVECKIVTIGRGKDDSLIEGWKEIKKKDGKYELDLGQTRRETPRL